MTGDLFQPRHVHRKRLSCHLLQERSLGADLELQARLHLAALLSSSGPSFSFHSASAELASALPSPAGGFAQGAACDHKIFIS